jgi:peptide/nickel transport system permease protein
MTIAASDSRTIPAIADEVPEFRRSVWQRAWIFCRRQPLGTFGLLIVVITALAGLTADWIAPYSPTANDFAAMTEPPS